MNLTGLSNTGNYYWQVRAVKPGAGAYADGSPAAFWRFDTGNYPPLAFGKLAPAAGSSGVGTILDLDWEASNEDATYEYCYDTSNDNQCSTWTSSGSNTRAELVGLSLNTPYYWQVRATNSGGTTYANGALAAFWSFTPTVASPPRPFGKLDPADGSTLATRHPTLDWADSSGATSYEYCYDTTDDDACASWISTGSSSSVDLAGLSNNTYYWQVRAVNTGGATYADGSPDAVARMREITRKKNEMGGKQIRSCLFFRNIRAEGPCEVRVPIQKCQW